MLCAMTWGRASATVASARSSPWKSGTRTSTLVRGLSRRSARMAAAKWLAPPSGWSSRFTEVTTMYSRSSSLTAFARFSGSAGSSGGGAPTFTWQKRHARVQTSPMSITVAVPPPQHSATLGHRACSQTVDRRVRRTMSRTCSYVSPWGSRTLSHSGFRLLSGFCGSEKRSGVAMRVGLTVHARGVKGPSLPQRSLPYPWRDGAPPHRDERLRLQALAEDLLPGGSARAAVALVLRERLLHVRAERHVLQAAAPGGGGEVARRDAGRVPLRREGQPVHHAHEAAGEREGGAGPVLRSRAAAAEEARRRALAAPAEHDEGGSRPAGRVPGPVAEEGPPRLRVPRGRLVHRRDRGRARPARRRVLRARLREEAHPAADGRVPLPKVPRGHGQVRRALRGRAAPVRERSRQVARPSPRRLCVLQQRSQRARRAGRDGAVRARRPGATFTARPRG